MQRLSRSTLDCWANWAITPERSEGTHIIGRVFLWAVGVFWIPSWWFQAPLSFCSPLSVWWPISHFHLLLDFGVIATCCKRKSHTAAADPSKLLLKQQQFWGEVGKWNITTVKELHCWRISGVTLENVVTVTRSLVRFVKTYICPCLSYLHSETGTDRQTDKLFLDLNIFLSLHAVHPSSLSHRPG